MDSGVKEDCWNLRDSYGEICVGCGCCAEDDREKYKNRTRILERWIAQDEEDAEHIAKKIEKNKLMLEHYKNKLSLKEGVVKSDPITMKVERRIPCIDYSWKKSPYSSRFDSTATINLEKTD